MTKHMNLIAGILMSTLLLTATAPAVEAYEYGSGSLTIYNKNCTKWIGLKKRKRVTVHVFAGNSLKRSECTNVDITVSQGQSVTGVMWAKSYRGRSCGKYKHEAHGTVGGKADVDPNEVAYVTCKKDRYGICQCAKH